MLAISESAAEAIRGLGDGPQAPEGAGLRIVARTGEGEDDVALELRSPPPRPRRMRRSRGGAPRCSSIPGRPTYSTTSGSTPKSTGAG
jgi:hypothetical protein